MTVCIAFEAKGGVWLGCDSYCGSDTTQDLTDRPKFFRVGALWFAGAGHCRASQLVEYAPWTCRRQRAREADEAYLTNVVGTGLERLLAGHKCGDGSALAFNAVLAYRGKAYEVMGSFSVSRSPHGYASTGAGGALAAAALAATEGLDAPRRAQVVLAAVGRHVPHVAPPYHVRFVPARPHG